MPATLRVEAALPVEHGASDADGDHGGYEHSKKEISHGGPTTLAALTRENLSEVVDTDVGRISDCAECKEGPAAPVAYA
ncbi:MAG TPA: hypothetical protein VG937_34400 [Polyangiaceae bacterium]|jgi:hypothetical protein|nr:hypothetical protein [Polyangiaceae bacterium]